MCGIAGFIGMKNVDSFPLQKTLGLMENRGPDSQSYVCYNFGNFNVFLLHSRLSIIDIDVRANQPYSFEHLHIVFNGELYNYIEVRDELKVYGYEFITDGDTEVLIKAYHYWGDSMYSRLEGMWAFAIYNAHTKQVVLSRDRFGEKPLYIFKTNEGIYFGSEIKFIKSMSGDRLEVNDDHVFRYLVNGYKALYKTGQHFYKGISETPISGYVVIDNNLKYTEHKYWALKSIIDERMSRDEAVEGVRERLIRSVKLRLRADVPLAFCLSGGVDSAALASIAAKVFNYDVHSFSIVDSDERYNELDNIMATVNDIECRHTLIHLDNKQDNLGRLKNLIANHDGPIATISYLVHSILSEHIGNNNFKVAISGTGADEMLTGYYDHFNLQLYCLRDTPYYQERLDDWNRYLKPVVRNPFLKDPDLYSKDAGIRDHIFLDNLEFEKLLTVPFHEDFTESAYAANLLHNRMMNELFHEGSRVILHEDDLNSMLYSIENRSPFLDCSLVEFSYTIPIQYLIENGYGKNVLRLALDGILNDQVRFDRSKKGFNASISSLFDFNSKPFMEEIMSEGKIFNYVDREKIEPYFGMKNIPNSISKFLFNFINIKYFLELDGK